MSWVLGNLFQVDSWADCSAEEFCGCSYEGREGSVLGLPVSQGLWLPFSAAICGLAVLRGEGFGVACSAMVLGLPLPGVSWFACSARVLGLPVRRGTQTPSKCADSRAWRLNAFRARRNIFAISLGYFGQGGGRSVKFYEGV